MSRFIRRQGGRSAEGERMGLDLLEFHRLKRPSVGKTSSYLGHRRMDELGCCVCVAWCGGVGCVVWCVVWCGVFVCVCLYVSVCACMCLCLSVCLDMNPIGNLWDQGAVSIRKTVLPGMAIPMLKIRRPKGRLIFNMEITIRR